MFWKFVSAVVLGFLAGEVGYSIWPWMAFRVATAVLVVAFFFAIEPVIGWVVDGAPIRLPWR
jgi:hypothetical protein